jgi:GTPase SAR1 family protein
LEYEFCCINKDHGKEYYQFKPNEEEKVLKKLTDMKVINILLLGLTGSGKTIFINSIANYFMYESLEEAKHEPLVYLIPTSFQITDDNYESNTVKVGEESETESFSTSESATRSPRIHTIIYNNMTINLIDTPVRRNVSCDILNLGIGRYAWWKC